MKKNDALKIVRDLERVADDEVHIVPSRDLREHLRSKDCWCNPSMDEEDESIIIHNALDGREKYENGRLN